MNNSEKHMDTDEVLFFEPYAAARCVVEFRDRN